jgi:FkbM family methyltransferase
MSLRRVWSSSGSIPTALMLSAVYVYSRLQAGSGQVLAAASPTSMRSSAASTALARRPMRFRLRDGSIVRCRIVDSGGLLSVNVDRDYDLPGVNWKEMKAIVDIGAHVGTFTVWAASRAPKARILAVEPNPETFTFLERNIRDNGLQDRVVAVNAAVGAMAGAGTLELVEHSLGTRLARDGSGTVKVAVQTIPSLLEAAELSHVDLLKIDCEGMEYEVFKALGSEVLSHLDAIACEYHPQPGHSVNELDSLMRGSGFNVQRPDLPLGVLWATR